MPIKSSIIDIDGTIWNFEYFDCDDFSILDQEKCTQCYSVCFVIDEDYKIVIVHNGKKDKWSLIGGTIEEGETFEDTLKRETLEEGNIEIIKHIPIGYQKGWSNNDVDKFSYQLRYASLGKKKGEFEKDLGGGSVDKIAFIHVDELNNHLNWGDIGKRIIERAKEVKNKF